MLADAGFFSRSPAGCPFSPVSSLGEGSPKIDYRKKCTNILSSLLEDLVLVSEPLCVYFAYYWTDIYIY